MLRQPTKLRLQIKLRQLEWHYRWNIREITLMNTIQYLDAVKTRHKWTSDYKLAQELQITRQAMSKYRHGKITIGDEMCLKVANLLEIAPESVLIDIVAERTKFPKVAKILRATAKQLASAAASLFITLSMIYGAFLPSDANAAGDLSGGEYVYYVK